MFKSIVAKNFKSFDNLELNFEQTQKKIKNAVFIYGENGAGKTNIIETIKFLYDITNSYYQETDLLKVKEDLKDFNKNTYIGKNVLELFMMNFRDLKQIFKNYKMVDSTDNTSVRYDFRIKNIDGYYTVEFDNNFKLINEELSWLIDERRGKHFTISYDQTIKYELSKGIFINNKFRKDLEDNIEQFWGKFTFLSILSNVIDKSNEDYIKDNLNHNLEEVIDFISGLIFEVKGTKGYGHYHSKFGILRDPVKGRLPIKDKYEIDIVESSLNKYITALVPDIINVEYELKENEKEVIYQLICYKSISGKIRRLNFELESAGTLHLLDLFSCFYAYMNGDVLFIDEIDTGIHDLLISDLLSNLIKDAKGQLVATTHNTYLMNTLEKESIYTIAVDSKGKKQIYCIGDEYKIQNNNNIMLKYLNGDFKGIPYLGNMNFSEIITCAENDYALCNKK